MTTTVSNAGPLIHLSRIARLGLLQQVFGEVDVPLRVRQEVLQVDESMAGLAHLRAGFAAGWLQVRTVADQSRVQTLTTVMDPGEAEAIALALEVGARRILLDDRKARREALQRGLLVMGTVGILRVARDRGLLPAAAPLLADLRRTGFWCSEALFVSIQQEEARTGPE